VWKQLNMQTLLFGGQEVLTIKNERVEHDYYPTPAGLTHQLIKLVPEIKGSIVGEPCSGQDAITDVLQEYGCIVHCSDIQQRDGRNRDATTPDFWKETFAPSDWVVTNPPFNQAEAILPLAWEHCTNGCAFLLRLSYLEPTGGRGPWLQAYADNLRLVAPVSPRPRFRKDTKGSDSVTSAWFVWDKSWSWKALAVPSPFSFCAGWRDN